MGIKIKIQLVSILLCIGFQHMSLIAQCDIATSNYDTVSVFNSCSHLTLNKTKDTITTAFCTKFRLREYSFQTYYFENMPANLMIYHHRRNGSKLVAEFEYDSWKKNEWIRHDYHAKSVPYRKQLLKQYLKTKDSIQYDQIEIIDKE